MLLKISCFFFAEGSKWPLSKCTVMRRHNSVKYIARYTTKYESFVTIIIMVTTGMYR